MRRIARVMRLVARPEQAWPAMAGIVAGISLWQGFGYAIEGSAFTQSNGWAPLLVIVRSLHIHGVIMAALGFSLALQVRGPHGAVMLWTLRALRTYALVVTFCWFASWVTTGHVTWGAPGWWLLIAALATWLAWFAPHRAPHGVN